MEKPRLKQKPVVLHTRHPRRGQCVAACSPTAQRREVSLGMTLAEATGLLEKAGLLEEAHIEAYNLKADRAALEQLAQWCDWCSPGVAVENSTNCLLLDVTGIGVLFGGEEKLAQQMADALKQRGVLARLAIADTIGAAWAAAHYRRPQEAAGWGLPSVIVAPSKQNSAWLASLPVEALRLSPQTIAILHRLGIERIEQLARLPRDGLAARFGQDLKPAQDFEQSTDVLKRLDQATGAVAELLACHRAPPEFWAEHVLEHPAEQRRQVERIIERLLEQLADQMRRRDLGAVRIRCRLDCGPGGPLKMNFTLFEPTARVSHLMELAQMQLAQLRGAGPVGRVRVEAPLTAPLVCRQGELFIEGGRGGRESKRRLAALVDRLCARLGKEQVLRPLLAADAQPERAWEYVSMVEAEKAEKVETGALQPPLAGPLARPLQLYDPPLRLPVAAVAPEGPPVRFRYRYGWRRAARFWGPERIETGWWRGKSVRRDYYRVETENGRRYWLFRQLEDGAWFLHGMF